MLLLNGFIHFVGIPALLAMLFPGIPLPGNQAIYEKLSTPVCQLSVPWWHTRLRNKGINDPLFANPKERQGVMSIDPPWTIIKRAIEVMDECERYDIGRALIEEGWLPTRRWDQPPIPPLDPKYGLQEVWVRLSNCRNYCGMELNDLSLFAAQAGQQGKAQTDSIDMLIYRPHAQPGDTGWQKVDPQRLKPGINTFDFLIHNVAIPSGFLNLAHTPSIVSLTVDVRVGIHEFTMVKAQTWQPPSVGWRRIAGGPWAIHLPVVLLADEADLMARHQAGQVYPGSPPVGGPPPPQKER